MENEYSLDFFNYCNRIWKEYLNYSEKLGINYISKEIENKFLMEHYNLNLSKYTGKKQRNPLNALNILNDFNSYNECRKKNMNINYVSESFKNDIVKINSYFLEVKNNSERTTRDKISIIKNFCYYLEQNNIASFRSINKDIVLKYISGLDNKLLSVRVKYCFGLRALFNYLYEEEILSVNYSYLLPVINRKHKTLPNVFEKEDVEKLLEYLKEHRKDSENGYRNYAMILMAAKTGLRKIDIINFKYKYIDWNKLSISLIQIKTSKTVSIPITKDITDAIIDYVNYERPFKLKSKDDYIFIRKIIPLEKLSNDYSFYPTISNAFTNCNIDINKYKKIGLHSFRYTLATEMLNKEVPVNIIASTLGHANKNSTKTYISINTKLLSKCMVEVPNEIQ